MYYLPLASGYLEVIIKHISKIQMNEQLPSIRQPRAYLFMLFQYAEIQNGNGFAFIAELEIYL